VSSPLDLVLRHASEEPGRIALIPIGGDPITYSRLAETVIGATEALRGCGVPDGGRIATVLDDSAGSAVLMLAASSAGVCAPLNPAYSAAEFDRALATLDPAVLVSSPGGGTARSAAERAGIPVAEWDDVTGRLILVSSGSRAATASPAPVGGCLLLQTSGTTSDGKLVPLSRATVMAAARATVRAYHLDRNDRLLNVMPMFHVLGFVGSLLATLCAGGSMVCATTPRPDAIPHWLHDHEATWFSAGPALHEWILERLPAGWPPPKTLRFVRSGAAPLPAALRLRMATAYGDVPIVETYGMTEAHQIASTPLVAGSAALVRTGSEVAVLADGEVTRTVGVRGELLVRGPNVIDRYLTDEDTASAFVDGWFRTGDEGVLAGGGALEITGRIKDLIIRGGEKVVPAEVEDVLRGHPAVADAVVVGVPDPRLTQQVGALIVMAAGSAVTDAELRDYARTRLAPHKVPTLVERRAAVPRTAHGKVSRAALAAEFLPQPENLTSTVAPAPGLDPIEAAVAGIWAAALQAPVSGRDESFFALGGESLTALRIIAMVSDVFGVDIDLLELFDAAATVGSMAALIKRDRAGDQAPPAGAAPPQTMVASPAQSHLWLADRHVGGYGLLAVPIILRLRGALDRSALASAVGDVVDRHAALRATFEFGAGLVQRIRKVGEVRPEMPYTDLAGSSDEEAYAGLHELLRTDHDLKAGVVTAALWRLAPDDHLFALNIHHLSTDMWSNQLVRRDLAAFYTARVTGRPVGLPELGWSYPEYQRRHAGQVGASAPEHVAYWREKLRGGRAPVLNPATLSAPAAPQRWIRQTRPPARHEWFALDDDVVDGLRALARAERTTAFVTLLAPYHQVLSEAAGQTDLTLGVLLANRAHPSTQETVGYLANMTLMRTRTDPGGSGRDLVRELRQTVLEGLRHQDFPFPMVPRDTLEHPWPVAPNSSVFHLLAVPPGATSEGGFAGLDVTAEFTPDGLTSRFDLELLITERRRRADGGRLGVFRYSPDRFDAGFVRSLAGRYRQRARELAQS